MFPHAITSYANTFSLTEAITLEEAGQVLAYCREAFGREGPRWHYSLIRYKADQDCVLRRSKFAINTPPPREFLSLGVALAREDDLLLFKLRWSEHFYG